MGSLAVAAWNLHSKLAEVVLFFSGVLFYSRVFLLCPVPPLQPYTGSIQPAGEKAQIGGLSV